MLKDTKKKEDEGDVKPRINKGVELMLQHRRKTPNKFNLKKLYGGNVLGVTLTLSAIISVLFLLVGGIIGWLYKDHVQKTTIPLMHPEMYDNNGNVIPDEIIAFHFENYKLPPSEEEEYEED